MAYDDLRHWISTLEKEGQLARVNCEVDWDRELGAIAREVLSRSKSGPALLFENIKDHQDAWCKKVFTNSLSARERVALSVGLSKDTPYRDIVRVIKERLAKPSEIKILDNGPVKENIIKGDDIDLFQIPVPQWRRLDGGRYIHTATSVVTRNRETGLMNVGTYRGQVVEKDRIGTILATTQHWGHDYSSYKNKNEVMPVAAVLGWDPVLEMLAGAPLIHHGCSEYEYASSLRQRPCELVKCETNDLLVPASAEIVIEGYISSDPSEFRMEGPFGEYTGYMGGMAAKRPTIKVTCITHRNGAIFRGSIEGCQPHNWSEGAHYTVPCFSAVTWNLLDMVGVPGVLDVWANPVTCNAISKVRIKKAYRGHAKQVANAIWGSGIANYAGKFVIVVDEDVDIHDYEALEHAIAHRVNPSMDQILFFPGTFGSMLDPSVPLSQRDVVKYGQGKWTRVLIDATINWELEPEMQYGNQKFPPSAVEIEPDDKILIDRRWSEYGIKA